MRVCLFSGAAHELLFLRLNLHKGDAVRKKGLRCFFLFLSSFNFPGADYTRSRWIEGWTPEKRDDALGRGTHGGEETKRAPTRDRLLSTMQTTPARRSAETGAESRCETWQTSISGGEQNHDRRRPSFPEKKSFWVASAVSRRLFEG